MSNLTKSSSAMETFKKMLSSTSVEEQFKNAMGKNTQVFTASLVNLVGNDKTLQACEPKAVIFEAMKAATLQLPISKQLGFAWIVVYKGSPTMQIGYKGYIQLALRSGYYKHINADVVYKGELRKKDKLTGAIDIDGEKVGDEIIGYFAHLELHNGFTKTLYMTMDNVISHAKKFSASYRSNSDIWKGDNFHPMALKTAIRGLLSKWGYLSIEMATAINDDIKADTVDEAIAEAIEGNATTPMEFGTEVEFTEVATDKAAEKPKDEKAPAAKSQPKQPDPSTPEPPDWVKAGQTQMFQDDKGK